MPLSTGSPLSSDPNALYIVSALPLRPFLIGHREQEKARGTQPIYGTNYLTYDDDSKSWGKMADYYDVVQLKDSDNIKYDPLAGDLLDREQAELFKIAFARLARGQYLPQAELQQYLHHLQEQRQDGSYVYMFSERQAIAMMPSLEIAPKGMAYHQFMNVMYHVHKETGWSAQKIIDAFLNSEGHYGQHPTIEPFTKKKKSCMIL
eukprot:m.131945 g.131945  ORF g.131945 m.131945 type:complete len:205 (-) comp15762_c0_seq6:314-928(-)